MPGAVAGSNPRPRKAAGRVRTRKTSGKRSPQRSAQGPRFGAPIALAAAGTIAPGTIAARTAAVLEAPDRSERLLMGLVFTVLLGVLLA